MKRNAIKQGKFPVFEIEEEIQTASPKMAMKGGMNERERKK